MKRIIPLLCILALFLTAGAQPRRRNIPPPLKVSIPFDAAWKNMIETLKDPDGLNLEIIHEDRAKGQIQTSYYDYNSGPLTASHIAKVGDRPGLVDGEWVRVKYLYLVQVALVSERETVVTVGSDIEALQRMFLGDEEWVDIPSTGRLETDLLSGFGRKVFGDTFALDSPKRGFWEHSPGYVNEDRMEPWVASPERKP